MIYVFVGFGAGCDGVCVGTRRGLDGSADAPGFTPAGAGALAAAPGSVGCVVALGVSSATRFASGKPGTCSWHTAIT
jgi:hypothetical protein